MSREHPHDTPAPAPRVRARAFWFVRHTERPASKAGRAGLDATLAALGGEYVRASHGACTGCPQCAGTEPHEQGAIRFPSQRDLHVVTEALPGYKVDRLGGHLAFPKFAAYLAHNGHHELSANFDVRAMIAGLNREKPPTLKELRNAVYGGTISVDEVRTRYPDIYLRHAETLSRDHSRGVDDRKYAEFDRIARAAGVDPKADLNAAWAAVQAVRDKAEFDAWERKQNRAVRIAAARFGHRIAAGTVPPVPAKWMEPADGDYVIARVDWCREHGIDDEVVDGSRVFAHEMVLAYCTTPTADLAADMAAVAPPAQPAPLPPMPAQPEPLTLAEAVGIEIGVRGDRAALTAGAARAAGSLDPDELAEFVVADQAMDARIWLARVRAEVEAVPAKLARMEQCGDPRAEAVRERWSLYPDVVALPAERGAA